MARPPLPEVDWNLVDFEEIYRLTVDGLRAYVSKRVPYDQVDDVVQETYLRAASGRFDRLENRQRLFQYLIGTALNVIRRSVYTHTTRAAGPSELELAEVPDRGDAMVDLIDHIALEKMLAGLPSDTRGVAMLCSEGLEIREIAKRVGLSAGQVKVRLEDLRRALRRLSAPPTEPAEVVRWWRAPHVEWGILPKTVTRRPATAPVSDDERIDAAIERLPVRQREVVRRRVHRGMKPREIAAELGITPNSARVSLCQGHATLAKLLNMPKPDLVSILNTRTPRPRPQAHPAA